MSCSRAGMAGIVQLSLRHDILTYITELIAFFHIREKRNGFFFKWHVKSFFLCLETCFYLIEYPNSLFIGLEILKHRIPILKLA